MADLPSCEAACSTYCETALEEMAEKLRPPDVVTLQLTAALELKRIRASPAVGCVSTLGSSASSAAASSSARRRIGGGAGGRGRAVLRPNGGEAAEKCSLGVRALQEGVFPRHFYAEGTRE